MNHPSEGEFWDDDDDGDADHDPSSRPVAKPDEMLRLHSVTAELFDTLKVWFDIDDRVAIDLAEIDSAVEELGDPQMIIALAMRKLQALHLLATPGVRTTTDVVVSMVNDLERAMVQAPNMWLKRRAATTDWDDELAAFTDALADGAGSLSDVDVDRDGTDPDDVDTGNESDDRADMAGDLPLESLARDLDGIGDDGSTDVVGRFRLLHGQLHDAMFAVIEASGHQIRELE